MAKELREQGLVFAEGDDAIANVARREHVELFAEASAGTAVVADRNHGAKVADDGRIRTRGGDFRRSECEALEAFQKSGKAGAAADGDHAESTLARSFFQGRAFCSFSFHRVNLDWPLNTSRHPGRSFPARKDRQRDPGTAIP